MWTPLPWGTTGYGEVQLCSGMKGRFEELMLVDCGSDCRLCSWREALVA